MIEFEKPNIKCLEIDNENYYAKFVCEPLERGYGITIGNSLRITFVLLYGKYGIVRLYILPFF